MTGTVIGKLLRQLMLKVREGDARFLQFVQVIGSRELEGKAAQKNVGFGDDQCNISAGACATAA
jgi:hypothetical protein